MLQKGMKSSIAFKDASAEVAEPIGLLGIPGFQPLRGFFTLSLGAVAWVCKFRVKVSIRCTCVAVQKLGGVLLPQWN